MKHLRYVSCILAVLFCFVLFTTSCAPADAAATPSGTPAASQSSGKDEIPSSVKIGIVNPTTGALAGFGEGTPWTENLIVDYVNNELGGIYFEDYDATLPIEIVVYDSQSTSTNASQMAQKLAEEDRVDILLAHHTPETVNPVCAVAERYGIPCISMDEPIDVWLNEGPYEWTYHAHWIMSDLYDLYLSMWEEAGFPAGSGAKVGFLFPSDADGNMFRAYFNEHLPEDGYTVVDPGQFPAGTTDYTDIVNRFAQEGVNIVVGANSTPDYGSFWLQAQQLGFTPDIVTMAKACLLKADAESIGAELVDGTCYEVWWSVDRTYTSALTGADPQSLAALYEADTGRPITPPMAVKYASMELAVAALQNAGSLDPEAIRDSLASLDLDTVMGHIKYNEDRYSVIALTGGQWQLQEDGDLVQAIIDNDLYPDVPLTGEMEPLK